MYLHSEIATLTLFRRFVTNQEAHRFTVFPPALDRPADKIVGYMHGRLTPSGKW